MIDRLAFDAPAGTETDGLGGTKPLWAEQFQQRVTIIYLRGGEAVEGARLAGRPVYKIKMRQSSGARLITTDWLARDVRRGNVYNITEVDAITDRLWVYLVVEGRTA